MICVAGSRSGRCGKVRGEGEGKGDREGGKGGHSGMGEREGMGKGNRARKKDKEDNRKITIDTELSSDMLGFNVLIAETVIRSITEMRNASCVISYS